MAESHEYRKKFFAGNFVFLGVLVLILLALFLLSDLVSSGKIDLTADRVYTTSPATKTFGQRLLCKAGVTAAQVRGLAASRDRRSRAGAVTPPVQIVRSDRSDSPDANFTRVGSTALTGEPVQTRTPCASQ